MHAIDLVFNCKVYRDMKNMPLFLYCEQILIFKRTMIIINRISLMSENIRILNV